MAQTRGRVGEPALFSTRHTEVKMRFHEARIECEGAAMPIGRFVESALHSRDVAEIVERLDRIRVHRQRAAKAYFRLAMA